jgi:hypothetical protein
MLRCFNVLILLFLCVLYCSSTQAAKALEDIKNTEITKKRKKGYNATIGRKEEAKNFMLENGMDETTANYVIYVVSNYRLAVNRLVEGVAKKFKCKLAKFDGMSKDISNNRACIKTAIRKALGIDLGDKESDKLVDSVYRKISVVCNGCEYYCE